MNQIKINVTEEDIRDGRPHKVDNCAIARAIWRELGRRDKYGIEVAPTYIMVDGKLYRLPKKGQQFVSRFDRDKKLAKPFSFMLREDKAKTHQTTRTVNSGYMPFYYSAPTYSFTTQWPTINF